MGSKKKKPETSSSDDSSGSSSESSDSSPKQKQKEKKPKKKDHSSSKSQERESPKRSAPPKTKKREISPERDDKNQSHKKSRDQSTSWGDRDHHNREERPRKRPHNSPPGDLSRDHKTREDHRDRDRGRFDNRREREDRQRDRNPDRRDRRDDREDFRNRREDHGNRNHNRNRDNNRNNNFNRRRRSRSGSFDHANAKWGRGGGDDRKEEKKEPAEKLKPNFGLSGKLTEETNTYRGVVIKYSEPPEARKPKRRWRLYPFKGEKALQTLYIHRESAYLIGRDRKLVDLPVDHPSCSKQHAALQYRLVPFTRDDGSSGKRVRPYLIDLESANGTFINNKKIDAKKYVELLEKDVVKFGFSSREYVLLHENSKDEALDDDVKQEEEEDVKVKQETN